MKSVFIVGKEFRFEAAHSLPHLPDGHKCRNIHGHSYKFRVDIEGILDDRGFVADYAEISTVVDQIVKNLDHKNLNDLEFFKLTTAEYIAEWLFFEIKKSLPAIRRIVLWETMTTMVEFDGRHTDHPASSKP